MAKKQGKHHIEDQIINLEINGDLEDQEVKEVQDSFIYFYKEYVVEALQKVFDELVPHDIDLKIESLELDLGTLNFERPQDLGKQIQRKIKEIVERVVRGKLQAMRQQVPRSQATGRRQTFSKMSILEHFLQKGHYPAWAGKDNGNVVELMEQLLKKNSKAVAQRLVQLRRNKRVFERLHQQFTAAQLQRILEALFGNASPQLQKQLQTLKKRLGKASEKAILSAAIDYILETGTYNNQAAYKEREFTRRLLEGVQQRRGGSTSSSKIRAGFEDQYSNLEIIEYFLLHGAIPAWGDVASKTSLHELMDTLLDTRVAGLQRLLERNIQTPSFIKRLILQFSDEQILRLLEPLPVENRVFIEDTLTALSFVTKSRQAIQQRLAPTVLRNLVLTEVLDYFFLQRKTNFVKKTFLKAALERLAAPTKTPYATLVKELYKSVRRRSANSDRAAQKAAATGEASEETADSRRSEPSRGGSFNSNIRQVLEQLDGKLQQHLQAERQELREAKRQYRTVERQVAQLLEKKEKGTLSKPEASRLRQLLQQSEELEATLLDLEDSDRPLDIEQVLEQRQLLQTQLRKAESAEQQRSEQEKLERRLNNTSKELKRLQTNLAKDVDKALRDQERLSKKTGSIALQRLQRVGNRLKKYQRAVQKVMQQLQGDQTNITLFLTNINRALRGQITNEEKQRLRQERTRLQKELVELNKALEELQVQEERLVTALEKNASLLLTEEAAEEEALSATRTSKLEALIFMLQYGATPWWAEELPRQSIEELFLEFADKAPQQLLRAFQQVGRYPVVWQRVMNQLSDKAIRTVITSLYPTSSQVIFEQANLLRTVHFAQAFDRLKNVSAKQFEWGVIVEYLLTYRQGFNAQDFVKEVTLQTARVHNISPSRLLELTTTIAKNKGEELKDFLQWNGNLSKDRSVAALERELASYQREQKAKEEGTFLDNQQQLEMLVEFLSTGRFTERAKAFKLTSQKQFEDILIQQIQNNRAQTKQVLSHVMRLSNARQFVIKNMDEDFFWELVLLLRPQMILPAKRHFEDLRTLEEDSNLALAKDVLFNLFITNPTGQLKMTDFVRGLALAKQQTTSRRLLPILTEWKRQLKARGAAVKSSMLLSVLLLEVDALKLEQREATDLDLKANLNEQINFLAKEYTDSSVTLVDVISAETAEMQAQEEKKYTYTELQALINKNRTELANLERQINSGSSDALDMISLQRNLLQYQATLEWLELQRPTLVRRLENSIRRLKRSMASLEEEIANIEETGTTLEATEAEEALQLSLLERQAQLVALLQRQNPVVVELLEPLLEDLKEEATVHALFFEEVQRLAVNLRDQRLQKIVVDLVEQYRPTITPLAELQRHPELEERQAALLRDFDQQAPVVLWQAWEALEAYFEANPAALTPERQQLQQRIYRAIRRREAENLRQYVTNLRQVQENLNRQLDQATTLEGLEVVQEQIEVLRAQQQQQAEELLALARDEKTRNDYKRLRRNIDRIFIRIQNTRIRRANAIRNNQEQDPKAMLTGQEAEVKALEEELKQVVLDLEDEEQPEKERQQPTPKRKRSKEPPKPKPIEEPLQIYNAGMVLLWPYIGRLFGMLGYRKANEWVNEEAHHKAIHLLQYLVTGKTEAPENELVLNKVMLGYPISEPVPFGIEFDPKELQTAESLLMGVIKNWPRMKSLVPNSLRGSFLMREGTVKQVDTKWEVKVQKKPFDILLKSIPWGYNFIRLPWNEYFITVEWKLL